MGASSNQQFYKEDALEKVLLIHNNYREMHSSPPLKLNKNLSRKAEDIVNYLIKDMNDNLDDLLFINDNQPLGVNIYNGDKKISPEEISKEWYNENKFYNYDNDKFQKNAIHFTQIVWKNTTEVGFAFTSKKSKKCIGVALYYPAGNIFDEFKDNVKPISK